MDDVMFTKLAKYRAALSAKSAEKGGANSGKVNVVRSVTLPNGKKMRVMRKDAFERALQASSLAEPA